jgi:hypothetical protein
MPNPITSISLYSCKLERSGHKTIDFTSAAARDSYFSSSNAIATLYSTITNATYARENKTITVGVSADELDAAGVNYVRYINPQFANRYFYSFVDNIEYVAPYTSRLTIRTDVWLTNIGSINADECLVEREHVADDTTFAHTLPEPVEPGELIYSTEFFANRDALDGTGAVNTNAHYVALFLFASEVIATSPAIVINTAYVDSYVGGDFVAGYYIATAPQDALAFVAWCQEKGMSTDNICYAKLIPREYITLDDRGAIIDESATLPVTVYNVSDNNAAQSITIEPNFAQNYTHRIRNNKLNCYPYRAYRVTNYDKSFADLRPEKMTALTFALRACLGSSPDVSLRPTSYNYGNDMDKAVTTSDFGDVPYKSSAYLEYLAQHKNTYQLTKALYIADGLSAVLSPIGALASGADAAVSELASSAQSVGSTIRSAQQYYAGLSDLKRRPPTVSGGSASNLSRINRCKGLGIYDMCMRPEIAEIVDSYFDQYGYNVSTLKVPQWSSRPHYNFVKTNGINIYGSLPKNEAAELARLFDEGLTIWHMSGGATYGVYDDANAPT